MGRRLNRWFCAALLITSCDAFAARIAISCGSVGKELDVCRTGAETWARSTGNEIEIIASPGNAGERLAQLQLLLAAKSPDVDVFLIDTTWPGMLADFLLDLSRSESFKGKHAGFFPSFLRNNTVDGKLVAIPWFIDAGLLYYRKDLLEKYGEKPPETWEQLTRTATKIQAEERRAGKARFWGFVFQARAYEGLTCNALEWIESFGGGSVVDPQGVVTIRNSRAREALQLAASWIGNIAPRGVLNFMEEEARAVFQTGDAVFMRNWPYARDLLENAESPVRGKVGVSSLPAGNGEGARHASALGGWSLAVSRYSPHPEIAASLVAYLTSPEEQKRRSELLGQLPSRPELFNDPVLLKIFSTAVSRPSQITGSEYPRVSAEFWESVHQILSGESSVDAALLALEKRLTFLSRGGKW